MSWLYNNAESIALIVNLMWTAFLQGRKASK